VLYGWKPAGAMSHYEVRLLSGVHLGDVSVPGRPESPKETSSILISLLQSRRSDLNPGHPMEVSGRRAYIDRQPRSE